MSRQRNSHDRPRNATCGLIAQKMVQLLCSVRGGTYVARRLAHFLNRNFFKGQWIVLDRERMYFAVDVESELEWQVLAYGGFDFGLQDYLKAVLFEGDVFLDIGGNIGCVCIPGASWVGPQGRSMAFEADPVVFKRLQHNAMLNVLPQWKGHSFGLSKAPGTLTFHRGPDSGAFGQAVGSLYASDWHQEGAVVEVAVDTLDHVLEGEPLERIDVIKIDVEGAELDVLKGGMKTLERFLPILCIEVCEHTYTAAGWCPADLFELLSPLGYTFEALDEKSPGQTRKLLGSGDRDYLTLIARAT
jgi:FkbM family methyltransferase